MADRRERRGLGRGLSALMADVAPPERAQGADTSASEALVSIDRISPNPDQPRRSFSKEALDELAASIREKGILQPLILRTDPADENRYQIVAGERRWRAAQLAQLHDIPAIVREFDDTEVLEVAIIENIQRANLNAIEEAAGYRQLIDRFGHTQERLAEALGKSRSHLTNILRLLNLPEEVKAMVIDGRLSSGHARALLTSGDPVSLAREIVKRGLSVRETERLAKKANAGTASKPVTAAKDADTRALEADLKAALKMRVAIDHKGRGGILSLHYSNLDQLDELCKKLSTTL